MKFISHKVPSKNQRDSLHLMEVSPKDDKRVVGTLLFLHGAIESGRVFYTRNGKGLAPFLAAQGYRSFILDLRARGESTPPLSQNFNFDQEDMLLEDFPPIFDFVLAHSNHEKISIVTHSWGGVLVNSFLLRFPFYNEKVERMVHISTKRRVSVFNLHRFFYIDLMWNLVGKFFLLVKGHLPAKTFGPEGESKGTLRDSQHWVYSRDWLGRSSKISYKKLVETTPLPPTLYLTGSNDKCLGHPTDVKAFASESGHNPQEDFLLLSRSNGALKDYDHLNILTDSLAQKDHFPKIFQYLSKSV